LSFNVFSSTFNQRILTGNDGSENTSQYFCIKTGTDGSEIKTGTDGSENKTGTDGSEVKTGTDGSENTAYYCQFLILEDTNL